MSGRLVILPHKSWNVWNQDNREKVLRDERLDREAQNKTLEEERQRILEKNYETLVGGSNSSTTLKPVVDGDVPFRLFADLESREGTAMAAGNPDYTKEKKDLEFRKRKREGVEDWALGDGSLEKQGIKPWYEKPSSNKPHNIERWIKNTFRNGIDDPMAHYIQQYVPDTYANEAKEMTDAPPVPSSSNTLLTKLLIVQPESPHLLKKAKKEKNDKHDKHKKEKKSHRPDINIEQQPPSKAKALVGKFDVEELRKRRLEREQEERKRAVRLLAEIDIYSSPGGSQQRHYSQQYNPNLARNNNK